jgi:hypothetical protein
MRGELKRAYRALERLMKDQAEADGDVYVPNPEPPARVNYILICMEPSMGGWAASVEEGRAKVAAGFRNFLAGVDPMLLHFSVRRFLLQDGQRYHMTDFSKGAMRTSKAGVARAERYDRWYNLLREEVDLLAAPGARIVAVGTKVAAHLRRRGFPRKVTAVMHYSPQASWKRAARLKGRERQFRQFARSLSSEDFVTTARKVIDESGVPPEFRDDALRIVTRARLSESRRQLIYCYKLDFEAMQDCP